MKLSLATRIFLGYAVVLATFGAVSIFSVAEMHRNQLEIRLVSQGYLHLSQDAAALETFQSNREKDTARILEERSPETRRALIRLSRLYFPPLMAERLTAGRERAQQVLSFAPDSEVPFVRELLQRFSDLDTKYRGYEAAMERAYATLANDEVVPEVVPKERTAELAQLEPSIGRDIRFLRAALESRLRDRVDQAEKRERRSGLLIIALSLVAIGVGLLATIISARGLRPVRTLIDGVSRISRGDYSGQLGVRGDDEIAVLAREFDKMARSLEDREAQLKEKQEALLRAEQLAAVGRISAQVAHEVRNPLSSIGLNVELLQESIAKATFETPTEAVEAKDSLASMLREIDRLTEVTEQYLGMARLPQPKLEPGNLNEVLGEVLDFSREELERAKVDVERRLDPATPDALADVAQLRQVFLNLLRNSREAMPQGGTLRVESRPAGEQIEVVFADTGRGMSGEVRDRIFEPFFTTKDGGTGLGLAVSRQILQAHGGSIQCQSAPGDGTTFVIRLPRS
ncbi:MAG TPA: ATP-binding protein [Myxococcaceae bacterium]|nr:ATP-binding protein [Myxococcaceae bacterium]